VDDLSAFKPPEVALRERTFEYLAALRNSAPVYETPSVNTYIVSRNEDLVAVAQDSTTFSSRRTWPAQHDPVLRAIANKGVRKRARRRQNDH
jgi:hypothetical protein